jgi:hypothetical protein
LVVQILTLGLAVMGLDFISINTLGHSRKWLMFCLNIYGIEFSLWLQGMALSILFCWQYGFQSCLQCIVFNSVASPWQQVSLMLR